MDRRLAAIDWMRGAVMVLMAVDHGSMMFNAGRVASDSVFMIFPGTPGPMDAALPVGQFLTRWITHLCAPTFLFLSGTSLALSTARRLAAGDSEWEIDRHLAIRAAVLLFFELALFTLVGPQPFVVVLQVLYAIALSLLFAIPLRRLSTGWLVGLGLLWFAGGEWVTRAAAEPGGPVSLLAALLVVAKVWPSLVVMYPVLPWLAMMLLGWALGRHLLALSERPSRWTAERVCAVGGLAGIAVFLVVRGANGYGNMLLYRGGSSLVEWLHVSKYPPALAFAALELGLMGLCLAALIAVEKRWVPAPRPGNPILLFGQTALFFYVLHIPLLGSVAVATGTLQQLGLLEGYLAAAGVLVVLYPACLWYRGYKRAHPDGWPQYL